MRHEESQHLNLIIEETLKSSPTTEANTRLMISRAPARKNYYTNFVAYFSTTFVEKFIYFL